MVTPPEEQFSYDGWLVFNEIFDTEAYTDDVDPEELVDDFPSYVEGAPNDSQSGFEHQEFPAHLSKISELTYDLAEFAEGLYAFRYVDENWLENWGYTEKGDEKMFYTEGHDEVDIFWDAKNDVMVFRGDKQLLGKKRSDLIADLSGDLKLNPIDFDFDFFLWLLYKKYEGENPTPDLRIREITRGGTVGDTKDNLGKHVDIEGSKDILRCVLMIAPILEGKKVNTLQGTFVLDSDAITAQIEYGGKVHVKVSEGPLRNQNDLRRMGIALRFMSELVSVYSVWENLDVEKKYPPESFFDELAENADDEGWSPVYEPEEVKREYRRKREKAGDSDDDGVSSHAD